jgi:hypothetical protein
MARMRVGTYALVSTYDEQTLPMQLNQMKEYIKHRGWDIGNRISGGCKLVRFYFIGLIAQNLDERFLAYESK